MSEEMQPIDPITAALIMGKVPEPCEPIVEMPRAMLTKLMDVVEFGDQLERVERDKLFSGLREVLAFEEPALYAMHTVGPGEVHPMISKEFAEQQAAELVAMFKEKFPDVPLAVNVIPSPYTPTEHYAILADELHEQVENLCKEKKLVTPDIGLIKRIDSAIHQFTSGRACMHVPPLDDDVDVVLDECHKLARATSAMTEAARDVLAERERQVTKEGWTPEHDDEHDGGEMSAAAAGYALNAADHLHPQSQGDGGNEVPDCWPWHEAWWKPRSPRRNLVKAAALILAEIERMDRKEKAEQQAAKAGDV